MKFQKDWHRNNKHNFLTINKIIPIDCVHSGIGSYGNLNVMIWNKEKEKLIIGNFVSIANNVTFILGGNHHSDFFMNYPACKFDSIKGIGSYSKGPIIIGDDVWIGYGAIILSGVKIGKGSVIGAGSVISKDVPPFAIVAGNPAKVVKFRFSENIINELNRWDYKNINISKAINQIDLLNKKLDSENLMKYNQLFI